MCEAPNAPNRTAKTPTSEGQQLELWRLAGEITNPIKVESEEKQLDNAGILKETSGNATAEVAGTYQGGKFRRVSNEAIYSSIASSGGGKDEGVKSQVHAGDGTQVTYRAADSWKRNGGSKTGFLN